MQTQYFLIRIILLHHYAQLLHTLTTLPIQTTPYFVAIDGFAGAGKSTLAKRLVQDLQQCEQFVQCLCLDDFYWPLDASQQATLTYAQAQQIYFDSASFCQQIVVPLQQGMIAVWRPVDWLTHEFLAEKQLQPRGIIIIEGVFSSHDDLWPYMHTSVMVVAASATQTERILQRPQPTTGWVVHWQETESWFHQYHKTAKKVAWLIAGDRAYES